jgi:endonuclease YncB( thermonuclease family)
MKSGLRRSLLLVVFVLGVHCSGSKAPTGSTTLTGYVIGIVDGDTYDILLPDKTPKRIRMAGIDAPEKGMPFYRVSKDYLGGLCFNKTVTIQVTGKDGDRIIGFSYLADGTELSREMLKAGMAWHFIKYDTDPALALLETDARKQKKGLWIDKDPMTPWMNRSLHYRGISTKDSFNIQENGK